MLPQDQRLSPHHLAGVHVDLRLVVQHKLMLLQRQADAAQAFMVDTQTAVLHRIKDVIPVFASHFGLIHGQVGLTQ